MPFNADKLYYRDADIYHQLKDYKNTSTELDHMRNSLIKCPYCGYEDPDSWEYSNSVREESIECGNCENEFLMIAEPEVFYSTSKKKQLK